MKIGNRTVVHTATVIVPDGEDAWVEFAVRSWNVRMNIVFQHDEVKAGEIAPPMSIGIEGYEDHGRLILKNWKQSLPTVTNTPIEVGKTDRLAKLSVMLWHTLTGAVHRLDLQFLEDETP